MASLLAGLPVTVGGTTVNRLCGSSLDAAMIGSRMIETSDAQIVIAGGVESMNPLAVGAAQTGQGVSGGKRDARVHDAGLAAGEPGHAEGVDGLPGRGQRAAPGEVR